VIARLAGPLSRSRRTRRNLIARRVRKAADSGASMNATFNPSCSAISANRLSDTVLPTPRRPIGM
jgi:hypothetical protein